MIDLKKAKLPQAVKVGGRFFAIHTDFKYILRFRELLSDKHTPLTAFDFMYKNEIPAGRLEGITAIYEFMNPPHRPAGDEEPARQGSGVSAQRGCPRPQPDLQHPLLPHPAVGLPQLRPQRPFPGAEHHAEGRAHRHLPQQFQTAGAGRLAADGAVAFCQLSYI